MSASLASLRATSQREVERYKGSTLSERIHPYLGEIASTAAETEAARQVLPATMRHIINAGYMRGLVPKAWGGDELDLFDFCDGVRTLTKACPSSGWVAGVMGIHPPAVPHFRPEVQQEIWGDSPDVVIGSSGTGLMKAREADGGVVISGRAKWSSGCDYSDWVMVALRVPNAADSNYPERSYRDHMFMAHRSQFEIDDTWYSTGMRGSGSKDLVFENVFIPLERMEPGDALNFGYSHGAGTVDGWVAGSPFPIVFLSFLPAIALGCADGMVEQFVKRQRTRKHAYTRAKGILNPAGQMRLAESIHELESISVYYKHVLDELQEIGVQRTKLSQDDFFGMNSRLQFITDRAVDVIDRLFKGSGSSAIADFNAMQRYWRDGTTARLHTGTDYDIGMQQFGRSVLGLTPSPDL